MRLPMWCFIGMMGSSLLVGGCNSSGMSRQESLGQGIVRGTLGAQSSGNIPATSPMVPTNFLSFKGQVTAIEGGAYVLREVGGIEHRVAHDENTQIDRPAHIGDRIEVFVDDRGRTVHIRNID